jgi:nucleoid DNA-binding protein
MSEKIGMQDLVVLLAEKANIARKDAETLVKECFDIMEAGLVEDKLLKIRNLGTFKLLLVEDRESVDVSTGERVLIPAHYKVTFTPDMELAEKVNAPYASLESVEIAENEFPGKAGNKNEIDDETDDETDDEFEGKFIEPGYSPAEIPKQEEPEIKKPKVKEPEIKEVENKREKIKTIYKEPEPEVEKEEEALDYSEQYDDEYQPVGAHNGFFWIFFLIASGFILFFAGRYFCPMISSGGRWHTIPDSVVVFSYSVNRPVVSDSLKVKSQKVDSAAIRVHDSLKVKPATVKKAQTTDNQLQKTLVNKKYKILRGERLNTIALREYGHKAFWVYIYDENRNAISNPDLIEPGMTINIPPAEKYAIDKNNRESVRKAMELEQKYKR